VIKVEGRRPKVSSFYTNTHKYVFAFSTQILWNFFNKEE
jgi:hypothetical protein